MSNIGGFIPQLEYASQQHIVSEVQSLLLERNSDHIHPNDVADRFHPNDVDSIYRVQRDASLQTSHKSADCPGSLPSRVITLTVYSYSLDTYITISFIRVAIPL